MSYWEVTLELEALRPTLPVNTLEALHRMNPVVKNFYAAYMLRCSSRLGLAVVNSQDLFLFSSLGGGLTEVPALW